jgi:hypothetical protein
MPHATPLLWSEYGWRTVRIGLLLYQLGMVVGALGVFSALIIIGMDLQYRFYLLPRLTALTVLGGMMLVLAGQFVCCSAPRGSRGKAAAVGSVIWVLAAFSLSVLFYPTFEIWYYKGWPVHFPDPFLVGLPTADLPQWRLYRAPQAMADLCSMLGHLLFAFFVQTTARSFGEQALARQATRYFWAFGVFGTASLLALFILVFGLQLVSPAQCYVLLGIKAALSLCGVPLFFWFIHLTRRVRGSIAKGIEEAGWCQKGG